LALYSFDLQRECEIRKREKREKRKKKEKRRTERGEKRGGERDMNTMC